jgi:hypothetical protein
MVVKLGGSRRSLSPRVFLGLIVGALAVTAYFGIQWQMARAAADTFFAAPACGPGQSSGCVGQEILQVVSTRYSYGRSGHYYVTLAQPGGAPLPEVQIAEGLAAWSSLQSGTQVTAYTWSGHVVEIEGSTPPVMWTTDHPGATRDQYRIYFLAASAGTLVLALFYVAQMLGLIGSAQPQLPASPSFEFSHAEDYER